MTLLDELVKSEKRSRSAVIREAVRELANLKQPRKRWPPDVEAFLANPHALDGDFAGFDAYAPNCRRLILRASDARASRLASAARDRTTLLARHQSVERRCARTRPLACSALAQHPDREMAISTLSVMESEFVLLSNPLIKAQRGELMRQWLHQLVALPLDTAAARFAATEWLRLRRSGTMFGLYDLLIAATALAWIDHGDCKSRRIHADRRTCR